jgi:hypothetical protein
VPANDESRDHENSREQRSAGFLGRLFHADATFWSPEVNTQQRSWTAERGWIPSSPRGREHPPQLVLVFGSRDALLHPVPLNELATQYPSASIIGCSTAGEILDTQVADGSVIATEVRFDGTAVRMASMALEAAGTSQRVGMLLAAELLADDLVHVLVFSDGLMVNGSSLLRGMKEILPDEVQITGGLAGDGELFELTLTCVGGKAQSGVVAAVGLYGRKLRVGYGSFGGWDPFGPERIVTRSEGNLLIELDGRSALELYKLYLGEYATQLPASALLFPLSLRLDNGDRVVRTVLGVDEEHGTMTFAGDLPEGLHARFMKANFERLIDGAVSAASRSQEVLGVSDPDLALLISCVGRRMVLGQRTEEELESVREIVGSRTALAGFYSYGEIAPLAPSNSCELHNQTMTITLLSEA